MYYVFNVKMQAWWLTGSVWGTALKEARQFSHEEALKFCRTRFTSTDGVQCFPVSASDLAAIVAK